VVPASHNSPAHAHAHALDIARYLIERGVCVFTARPVTDHGAWVPDGGPAGCGYWIPKGWQHTEAHPAVLDRWEPGTGLGAVMGHAVDGLDVDPRHGGTESLKGIPLPVVAGVQATPSGGWHGLIAPLGVGSRDGVRPGIDVKGGRADGTGRGFLWIAPTVKLSKTTGEIAAYRWIRDPDLSVLDADASGAQLATMITQLQAPTAPAHPTAPPEWDHPGGPVGVIDRVDALAFELSQAPTGQGNHAAARVAFMVGGYVGAGQITQDQAVTALTRATAWWKWRHRSDAAAMALTIERQVAAGARNPRPWKTPTHTRSA
jgi:hypothetical protein